MTNPLERRLLADEDIIKVANIMLEYLDNHDNGRYHYNEEEGGEFLKYYNFRKDKYQKGIYKHKEISKEYYEARMYK